MQPSSISAAYTNMASGSAYLLTVRIAFWSFVGCLLKSAFFIIIAFRMPGYCSNFRMQ